LFIRAAHDALAKQRRLIMMYRRLTIAFAFFLLLSGALFAINAQDQRPRPTTAGERAPQISEREALRACGASPIALREIITKLPGSQGYHCPAWSTHCWCSGGGGSTDCNNLKISGNCSGDIQTGTSADGKGLSGICKK
jgi:hypothetical protein